MPGPVYNWFCVAHSILDVLSNAAAIRVSQVYPRTTSAAAQRNLKRRTAPPVDLNDAENVGSGSLVKESPLNALGIAGDAHIGAFHVRPRDFGTYLILQANHNCWSTQLNNYPTLPPRLHFSILSPKTLRDFFPSTSTLPNPKKTAPLRNPLLGSPLRWTSLLQRVLSSTLFQIL